MSLLVISAFIAIYLPKTNPISPAESDDNLTDVNGNGFRRPSVLNIIRVPDIAIATYCVAAGSVAIGYLQATLEPHLREFNLSPLSIGLLFVIQGAFYGVGAPVFGFLCDKLSSTGKTALKFSGPTLIVLGFILVGPLPFLHFLHKSMTLIIVSLVLNGVGVGAEVVAGFADAQSEAIAEGFPNTTQTHGVISGLWGSAFAFGAFVGPTVSGVLFEAVGFAWGTLFVIGIQIVGVIAGLSSCLVKRRGRQRDDSERARLVQQTTANSYGTR